MKIIKKYETEKGRRICFKQKLDKQKSRISTFFVC